MMKYDILHGKGLSLNNIRQICNPNDMKEICVVVQLYA